eukprot:4098087-Amphidinium_carterae.2
MQIKHNIVVSRARMRRFMLGLGLNSKAASQNTIDKNFTMQQAHADQRFLACKTLWLQREHGIRSGRASSLGTHCFKEDDTKIEELALGKVNKIAATTCTLMLSMMSDYDTSSSKGTTVRCMPTAARHSQSHPRLFREQLVRNRY